MENNSNISEDVINNYYVNSAEINGGVFDFYIKFKHMIDDTTAASSFNVVMSPQHAKSLLLVLSNSIKCYEDAFGEIQIQPKGQLPPTQE